MKPQTKAEIKKCQEFLQRIDISDHDRDQAERGLNDWFMASLFEDGLLDNQSDVNLGSRSSNARQSISANNPANSNEVNRDDKRTKASLS